jgi:hypothetical protein
MIREFEFYHGLVFSRLIHAYDGQIEIKPYPTPSNSSYILNGKVGLYIKYSAKRMTPWGFSFKQNHQEEIHDMRSKLSSVFVLLVCNDDGIVCLNERELRQVLDDEFLATESIRVHRNPREKYSVSGTDGKLKLKIGESDFPKKLFTETEVPKKLSVLSYLGIK